MKKTELKLIIKEQIKYILENVDLSKEYAIANLFIKYETTYTPEIDETTSTQQCLKGLKESLKLIGNGKITEKPEYDYKGDRLMYMELFKDNSLILIIFGAYTKSPYGGLAAYRYNIGVYKNDPHTVQYGGGYGATGILETQHTKLLGYSDESHLHYNKNIISKVCKEIKKYAIDTF
jgi:hypothetical protein